MGLSHAEFFRTLPAAMGDLPYRVEAGHIIVEHPGQRLDIRLDPQSERRIAGLAIPSTRVWFAFHGYARTEIDAFLTRFARYYQRGGG